MDQAISVLASDLSKQLLIQRVDKIAVVDFYDLADRVTPFGDYVSQNLATALVNADGANYSLVERRRLEQVLQEQNLGQSGALDDNTVAELQKVLGVDAIVLGEVTYFPSSGQSEINASVLSTTTAMVFTAAKVNVARDPKIDDLMGRPARVESSRSGRSGGTGRTYSNRHFTVEALSLGDNEGVVTVSLRITNTSREPIEMKHLTDTCKLTDDKGRGYSCKSLTGLARTRFGQPEAPTYIGAGESALAIYEFSRQSRRSSRSRLSGGSGDAVANYIFTTSVIVYTRRGERRYTIGIPGLR
ncbi:MAG: CsgG/HfaB family protein [Bacteroidota bacterium]